MNGCAHQASPNQRLSCHLHQVRHSRCHSQPIQMGWRAPSAVVAGAAAVREDAPKFRGGGSSCL